MNKQQVTKIVLTGGPCAGKSSSLALLIRELSKRGFFVVTVPEGARDFLRSGLDPVRLSGTVFQQELLLYVLERENRFAGAATRSGAERIVLLCDRGAMDARAYMVQEDFNDVLRSLELTIPKLREGRYDAVIHLQTAADGAEAYYSQDDERQESPEQARALDRRTQAAWIGHPHFVVVDNSTGFDEKKQRVLREVLRFLGVPVPTEIERKYRIERPGWSQLPPDHQVIDISQTYLLTDNPNEERRIRRWSQHGATTYFETTKRASGGQLLERVEEEKQIPPERYQELLAEADPARRPIEKRRYCFLFQNQYFELDDLTSVRPGLFVLEIELTDKQQTVVLPDFITVIEEVTNNPAYTNNKLALVS